MIAFDSNVLIYALRKDPYKQREAVELFREVEVEGGVCSALIITESLYGALREFDQLTPLLSPAVSIAPVSKAVAEYAGNLKIEYGLKAPDAIHLATAILAGADEFVTNDLYLLKKKIKGLKIRSL